MSHKVKYSRKGVTRLFDQDMINQFSTEQNPFPESEGWEKCPEEVEAADAAADKAASEKAANTDGNTANGEAAAGAGQEVDNSSKYVLTDVDNLRKKLEGKSKEEIEKFFAGEERKGMLKLLEELVPAQQ